MNISSTSPILISCLCLALITIFLVLGYQFGLRTKKKSDAAVAAPFGAAIAAILGLIAFLIAFTFNIAVSRFDARRQLVLEESNALGTLYLRSQLLPAPFPQEFAPLIRNYVEMRTESKLQGADLAQVIADSEKLQDTMWRIAQRLAKVDPASEIISLFIDSLNSVIDLHSNRVVYGLYYRIPLSVWGILACLAAIGMLGVGYQFALAGRMNGYVVVILALSFSAVVFLIADLDSQTEGLLRVSQQPMQDLFNKLSFERTL